MLRLHQHTNASAAKSYYEDMAGSTLTAYYPQEPLPNRPEQTIANAEGKLATRLNLVGGITKQQFEELIDGVAVNPLTGERLRKRINRDGNNRVGVDITFDTGGKSISAYYAATQDPLVLKLFQEARQETMEREVEPRMMVRVRQGGANHSKITGNAMWTSFPDLVTRPTKVKGDDGKWRNTFTADPHIHDHNYVLPYTYDAEYRNKDGSKGAVLAADMSRVWRDKPVIQQAFHARLFKKLQDAGFNVVRSKHGIDLAGWTPEMSDQFSRRSLEIEDWAKRKGITSVIDKSKGGRATRGGKDSRLSIDEQFAEWRSRLDEETWEEFFSAAQDSHANSLPEKSIEEAIDFALEHTLERNNSVTYEEVLLAALEVGFGLDVDELKSQIHKRPDLVKAKFGDELLLTTRDNLKIEQELVERATRGVGNCLPYSNGKIDFQKFDAGGGNLVELNANQKENLTKLLQSKSRFMTLRGAPGVGKTAALATQMFPVIEAQNGQVIALGTTSNSRDQLIQFGEENESRPLASAVTLAKFLRDDQLQEQVDSNTLLMLDEATLAGFRDLSSLTKLVEKKRARLLLVGDHRQHDAVPAHAKVFQQLSKIGPKAEFTQIVRQRDPGYREAVDLTASGESAKIQEGVDRLSQLGFVHQVEKRSDRIVKAADTYREITSCPNKRKAKPLDWSVSQKQEPQNYRSGMTIAFRGRKTARYQVVGREDGRVMVQETGTNGPTIPLNLGKAEKFDVLTPTYTDALVVTATHRDGQAVTRAIRSDKQRRQQLGADRPAERLENLGWSSAERGLVERYEPGLIVEFSRKDKVHRTDNSRQLRKIEYGEQFKIQGCDASGNVVMIGKDKRPLVLPIDHPDRFDVYQSVADVVAVGDKIRMTKGGKLLADRDGKEVRFANNRVFTIEGVDADGNYQLNNGRTLSSDWKHWRSGYYTTSIGGQGSTTSHAIVVDSKASGKARTKESWLVAISRGKHAATILTDDVKALRETIVRSGQRRSAIEIALQQVPEAKRPEEQERLQRQKSRLEKVEGFAREASEQAMRALRRRGKAIVRGAKRIAQQLAPEQEPAT